jgi:hypothetical protein
MGFLIGEILEHEMLEVLMALARDGRTALLELVLDRFEGTHEDAHASYWRTGKADIRVAESFHVRYVFLVPQCEVVTSDQKKPV